MWGHRKHRSPIRSLAFPSSIFYLLSHLHLPDHLHLCTILLSINDVRHLGRLLLNILNGSPLHILIIFQSQLMLHDINITRPREFSASFETAQHSAREDYTHLSVSLQDQLSLSPQKLYRTTKPGFSFDKIQVSGLTVIVRVKQHSPRCSTGLVKGWTWSVLYERSLLSSNRTIACLGILNHF